MSELMKWPKQTLPEDWHRKITHLWLMHEDGRVEVVEKVLYDDRGYYIESDENARRFNIHAEHWGEMAWDNDYRGYYSEEYGIVTCHGGMEGNPVLIHKLARKFRNAIYYKW